MLLSLSHTTLVFPPLVTHSACFIQSISSRRPDKKHDAPGQASVVAHPCHSLCNTHTPRTLEHHGMTSIASCSGVWYLCGARCTSVVVTTLTLCCCNLKYCPSGHGLWLTLPVLLPSLEPQSSWSHVSS